LDSCQDCRMLGGLQIQRLVAKVSACYPEICTAGQLLKQCIKHSTFQQFQQFQQFLESQLPQLQEVERRRLFEKAAALTLQDPVSEPAPMFLGLLRPCTFVLKGSKGSGCAQLPPISFRIYSHCIHIIYIYNTYIHIIYTYTHTHIYICIHLYNIYTYV
jgi:hypothetical protein